MTKQELEESIRQKYGRCKAKEIADSLNVSIYTVYNTAKKLKLTTPLNPVFTLTHGQKQILLGGKLGDGSFKKNGTNYYYRECHAIGEKDYLLWKYNMLRECSTEHVTNIPSRNGYSPQIAFQTRNSAVFTEFATLSIEDAIFQLDELGFIIWLLDDGWICKNSKCRSISISSGTLTERQQEMLIEKAVKLGLSMHCVGKRRDFSLASGNNSRIKEMAYRYFSPDMDIIIKKINDLQIKDNGGLYSPDKYRETEGI